MKVEKIFGIGDFEIGDMEFELINFFESDEAFVEGTVMLKRARKVGAVAKQEMIKVLLAKEDILDEMKDFDIVCAGTIKCIGKKIKVIPYLHNHCGSWVTGLGGVNYDWHSRARLLRVRN